MRFDTEAEAVLSRLNTSLQMSNCYWYRSGLWQGPRTSVAHLKTRKVTQQ